jgi:hypothetical protein
VFGVINKFLLAIQSDPLGGKFVLVTKSSQGGGLLAEWIAAVERENIFLSVKK